MRRLGDTWHRGKCKCHVTSKSHLVVTQRRSSRYCLLFACTHTQQTSATATMTEFAGSIVPVLSEDDDSSSIPPPGKQQGQEEEGGERGHGLTASQKEVLERCLHALTHAKNDSHTLAALLLVSLKTICGHLEYILLHTTPFLCIWNRSGDF